MGVVIVDQNRERFSPPKVALQIALNVLYCVAIILSMSHQNMEIVANDLTISMIETF